MGGGARGRQARASRATPTGAPQTTTRPATRPVGGVARRGSRRRHHRGWTKGRAAEHMSAGEVLRAALGLEQSPGWPAGDHGRGGRMARGPSRRCRRPTPKGDADARGFAGELRPYQERGLGWLAFLGDLGLGACLADDMGLGKTAQLLALLVEERARGVEGRHGRGSTTAPKRRTATPRAGPDARAVPDVAGRQLAAGGRPLRSESVGLRASRAGSARRERLHPPRHHGGSGAVDLRVGCP